MGLLFVTIIKTSLLAVFRLPVVSELVLGIAQRVFRELRRPGGDVRPVMDLVRCRVRVPRDVAVTIDQEELEACP